MPRLPTPHLRLHNQRITAPLAGAPADVVRWLVAVQSQDFAGASWAVGLRLQGAVAGDVERAFDDGAILRTHLLRPTWHFATPRDIRWLLALTGPRVHGVNGTMYRQLGLDEAIRERSREALAAALRGGRHLTRDELRGELEGAGIVTDGALRMAYLMMDAELEGIVCSGPRRGKQFTYALLDERAPIADAHTPADPLTELARRFLAGRGPAGARDLGKWSGLTLADAHRGIEAVAGEFERDEKGGEPRWYPSREDDSVVSAPPSDGPRAELLSIYDEYISSYQDRSDIGDVAIGSHLAALGNGLQFVVVVDGQVVGAWRRAVRKAVVAIEANVFRPLSTEERDAIVAAGERYAAFLGLRAELDFLA